MSRHKLYTLHINEGEKGCVLESTALRATHGIDKIRFLTIRQAAVFAQRHANGDAEATLRVHQHGHYDSRPIPLPESWVPDEDADFHAAFVALPVRLFRMPNGCIFIPTEETPLPGKDTDVSRAANGKFVEK